METGLFLFLNTITFAVLVGKVYLEEVGRAGKREKLD